ncbi:hypothetical protein D769_19258 [Cupriavidus sp. HMR-1]|uniref:hypothetical protein n=1 Tax=Cupriavidus sp. HMR-1 TaxID=1249621 RepID=UPI0002A20E55|nr:hypothetical protein [Cupriavidus sp. HMR-1]EKZ97627.1 hypothetical protein D769_19258 [Cupriavidus sp. HMR-1]
MNNANKVIESIFTRGLKESIPDKTWFRANPRRKYRLRRADASERAIWTDSTHMLITRRRSGKLEYRERRGIGQDGCDGAMFDALMKAADDRVLQKVEDGLREGFIALTLNEMRALGLYDGDQQEGTA